MSDTPKVSQDLSQLSDAEVMNMPAPPVEVPLADDGNQDTPEAEEQGEGSDEESGTDSEEAADSRSDEGAEDDDTPPESDAVQDTQDEIDYKAEYNRLLAPFKANGKEIKLDSIDDAISLMQMGANYNKKMAALKPNLKLMKMLQNNDLLNEDKLSFLIDLSKKDPAAVNKFIKDSGIDPMDLDVDSANDYKQGNHSVDDQEIELDTVLEEIKDSPAYQRTISIVGSEWDKQSRAFVATHPELIKIMNAHVENGVYDVIAKGIEQARMLGKLQGLSDLEAYREIGDALQASGGFDHLKLQGNRAPTKQKVVPPNPKKVTDAELNDKRRAASPTKASAPASSTPVEFDPLGVSDEDFGKLVKPKFL